MLSQGSCYIIEATKGDVSMNYIITTEQLTKNTNLLLLSMMLHFTFGKGVFMAFLVRMAQENLQL